jgi:hypothetical protein
MSFSLSHAVITHKIVPFLAPISFTLETVFSLITHLGFMTTQGKLGPTNARGQCFNSQVEYASAWI